MESSCLQDLILISISLIHREFAVSSVPLRSQYGLISIALGQRPNGTGSISLLNEGSSRFVPCVV